MVGVPVAAFGFIGAVRHAATDGNKDEVKVVRDDASEPPRPRGDRRSAHFSLSRHANRPEFFRLGVDIEGEIEDVLRQDILKVFVSCLAAGEPTRLVAAPRDDLVVRASARALSWGQGLQIINSLWWFG